MYWSVAVFNSDQSGFQLKIHSKRTLFNQGIKKVVCCAIYRQQHTHTPYNQ